MRSYATTTIKTKIVLDRNCHYVDWTRLKGGIEGDGCTLPARSRAVPFNGAHYVSARSKELSGLAHAR